MSERTLRVDWPECRARGVCHELAPELIDLDPWGYPIVLAEPASGAEEARAREAVAGCPRQALRWVKD